MISKKNKQSLIKKVDQVITDAENEVAAGAETVELGKARKRLDSKFYNQVNDKAISEGDLKF